jgi:hypothetical protein
MFFQNFIAFKQISRDPAAQGILDVAALIRMPMFYINVVAPVMAIKLKAAW